jgi:hypothetical protein
VLALTVDQTEILRDLATVIQKQADTIRRLELLEDELRTAKTSVYRIVWVIMVTLLLFLIRLRVVRDDVLYLLVFE